MLLLKHKGVVICILDPDNEVVRDMFENGAFETLRTHDGATIYDPTYLYPGESIRLTHDDLDVLYRDHVKPNIDNNIYEGASPDVIRVAEELYKSIGAALLQYKDDYFTLSRSSE